MYFDVVTAYFISIQSTCSYLMLTTHFYLVNMMVTLGRPMQCWKDNIKIDLEVLWDCVDWIDLVVDSDKWLAVVNTVMNLCLPSKDYTALWI